MSEHPPEMAMARLDDDEVRARVRAGDFSDFEDLSIDDEQQAALAQVAENFGEVAGFAMDVFSTFLGGLDPGKSLGPGPSAQQVSEVKVRGWEPGPHKNIVGRPSK